MSFHRAVPYPRSHASDGFLPRITKDLSGEASRYCPCPSNTCEAVDDDVVPIIRQSDDLSKSPLHSSLAGDPEILYRQVDYLQAALVVKIDKVYARPLQTLLASGQNEDD